MNFAEGNSSILENKTFENAFDALLKFFTEIKNKILSNNDDVEYKNNVENILNSSKNIILSNLDVLIALSRIAEEYEDYETKNSYFLIRLKDMLYYILLQKSVNVDEMNLLTEILYMYYESLLKRREIMNSNVISINEKINKNNLEFGKFYKNFSDKEMDFYSLIDSDEETYKKSISATYELFMED